MKHKLLPLLAGLFLFASPLLAESLFKLDFSEAPDGDAARFLHMNNFALQEDAREKIKPKIKQGRLYIELTPNLLGGMALGRDIPGAKRVKVVWGVTAYPKGASWNKEVRRENAMFLVAFGRELQESDSLILPKVPYFLGAFLNDQDTQGLWYKGLYYTQAGRYICLPCKAPVGQDLTTEMELPVSFQARFGKPMPPVIGFGFEFDTRETEGNTAVFIRSVEFFSE
ncbi:MAG: hypothetical protein A2600_00545 [Candidatus Lambdaproteobacteria bacterium RIFOXYD1_FULL_56_27]|uniref:DUF3047 domain-containing protein n=1 Tax=Candidatus Lambdaproteobacteria bacterium RIFOXYD2_FULL_56_26 TaxID=1817773 RepID=A0A1F6GLW1_9PROT|nr:MAG: hypothetical protein A2557_09975 [Candidatus Lambdaproteobacteria bacterium RIFOXYD2_FULL_56_26]OGH01462.1 MAG: hypothetical protein A2426_08760 [Candidatus Lambdaproteobacteria bacterium RIFOXYC1_FULL_56_13]OGH07050.1 MAG: hypothetical protein A2600_00545 [Candidatus Lambdaproteobacteria bacterium RIFOXYD1_FULL_56_27]